MQFKTSAILGLFLLSFTFSCREESKSSFSENLIRTWNVDRTVLTMSAQDTTFIDLWQQSDTSLIELEFTLPDSVVFYYLNFGFAVHDTLVAGSNWDKLDEDLIKIGDEFFKVIDLNTNGMHLQSSNPNPTNSTFESQVYDLYATPIEDLSIDE
ncbi:MAG: hypothetical protein ACPG4W_03625 [Flavobacteriales bacterium]